MALLLEGDVEDPKTQRIAELETENRTLRRDLADAQVEADRAREDANRALAMLRRQLSPLYRALQAVFGELDAAGIAEDASPSASRTSESGVESRVAAVWESWKEKLGRDTGPSRVIDALLQHGELNVAQLKVAGKMATQTVYDSTSKLNRLGLLNKNGGRYSLKKL